MIFHKHKFKKQLQIKEYASSSIDSYIRRLEHYEKWCKLKQNIKIESDKALAYQYFKHLQKRTSNSRTLNRELQPLKLYYKLCRKNNPFEFIYVKRQKEIIKTNFFSKEELEIIYDSYPQNSIYEVRDKVLLSFYIFQGVKSSEAKNIETQDLDLIGYKILLRGDKRTNQRKIGLHIKQILLLNKYLNSHRRRLLKRRKSNQLIIASNSNFAQQNLLQRVSAKLKKTVCGFEALSQIRASVVHQWTKEYDLRKAQYLSGHRYISTTEKFIVKDLKGLQKAIDDYSPI